jgi:hypothetical protein
MEHVCERCGYKTNLKGNLIKHLKCKNVCQASVANVDRHTLLEKIVPVKNEATCRHCEWCDKLISKTNMGKHKKVCKHKPASSPTESNSSTTQDVLLSEQNEIQIMREEIRQLRQELNNVKQSISSPSNVNIANVENMNIVNVQLNSFGNESVEHITNEFIGRCIQRDVNGMKNLIEKIHFSEEAPENKNIRMKSRKDKLVEVQRDNKWEVRDARDATESMIKKGVQIVSEYYHDDINGIKDYDDNALQNRIQNFLIELLGKNSNKYYDLRNRIFALIVEYT